MNYQIIMNWSNWNQGTSSSRQVPFFDDSFFHFIKWHLMEVDSFLLFWQLVLNYGNATLAYTCNHNNCEEVNLKEYFRIVQKNYLTSAVRAFINDLFLVLECQILPSMYVHWLFNSFWHGIGKFYILNKLLHSVIVKTFILLSFINLSILLCIYLVIYI